MATFVKRRCLLWSSVCMRRGLSPVCLGHRVSAAVLGGGLTSFLPGPAPWSPARLPRLQSTPSPVHPSQPLEGAFRAAAQPCDPRSGPSGRLPVQPQGAWCPALGSAWPDPLVSTCPGLPLLFLLHGPPSPRQEPAKGHCRPVVRVTVSGFI